MNEFKTEKLKVGINNVRPNLWNPNKEDDFIFEKAKASITKWGFIDPILVRVIGEKLYEIIDGEHRWRACKELGYTEIEILNLGQLTDEEAKTLTLTMNNVKGADDPIKRGLIFKDLKEKSPELLELMPFTQDVIASEIELINFEVDYHDEELPEKTTKTLKFDVPLDEVARIEQILKAHNKDYDVAFLEIMHKIGKMKVEE